MGFYASVMTSSSCTIITILIMLYVFNYYGLLKQNIQAILKRMLLKNYSIYTIHIPTIHRHRHRHCLHRQHHSLILSLYLHLRAHPPLLPRHHQIIIDAQYTWKFYPQLILSTLLPSILSTHPYVSQKPWRTFRLAHQSSPLPSYLTWNKV